MAGRCEKLIFVTLCTNILDLFFMLDLVDFELKVDPKIWIQIQIKPEIDKGYIVREHRHCWKWFFPVENERML